MTCVTACLCDRDELATELLPVALRFVGAVRDEGPDASAGIYAEIPPAHADAFAVILAAMVDVDQSTKDLLAWIDDRSGLSDLPVSNDEGDWTPDALRKAHRLYRAGSRELRVVLGERVGHRVRARQRRYANQKAIAS
jgi:hypothetical protein